MNLAYTIQITINGEHVLQRADMANAIPSTIKVRKIEFWPAKDSTFPNYQVKGIGSGSGYIDVYGDYPISTIDHISDDISLYCYIKTTESIVFNVAVYGTV